MAALGLYPAWRGPHSPRGDGAAFSVHPLRHGSSPARAMGASCRHISHSLHISGGSFRAGDGASTPVLIGQPLYTGSSPAAGDGRFFLSEAHKTTNLIPRGDGRAPNQSLCGIRSCRLISRAGGWALLCPRFKIPLTSSARAGDGRALMPPLDR